MPRHRKNLNVGPEVLTLNLSQAAHLGGISENLLRKLRLSSPSFPAPVITSTPTRPRFHRDDIEAFFRRGSDEA